MRVSIGSWIGRRSRHLKLMSNVKTIFQDCKVIDHECKFLSNGLDLMFGDIGWSNSVTDLDDGKFIRKRNL